MDNMTFRKQSFVSLAGHEKPMMYHDYRDHDTRVEFNATPTNRRINFNLLPLAGVTCMRSFTYGYSMANAPYETASYASDCDDVERHSYWLGYLAGKREIE